MGAAAVGDAIILAKVTREDMTLAETAELI